MKYTKHCMYVATFLVLGFVGLSLSAQQERKEINFEFVAKEAQALIQKPPRAFAEKLSKPIRELSYDDYRNIRFRPSEALWWNDPSNFRVEFFHLGNIFRHPVEIFEFSDTHVQKIPFREDAFNYENSSYKPGIFNAPENYAGIRIKYPLNTQKVYDDLIVFLGASYFRALGPNQTYGLSLRGICMNTLGDSEDFPRFTKLWLKKPKEGASELTVYALLEGKKVTGAYAFKIAPTGTTNIDVTARLFFRENGADEVGLAPITSMFMFGENSKRTFGDWRPEVHDSDGLLIKKNAYEWTWQPLDNPRGVYSKFFEIGYIEGFGLMQRDRNFHNYQDLEANYQNRPSAWISPSPDWPEGSVVLYTFETNNEATDNVTAFWKPNLPKKFTGPLNYSYQINLQLNEPSKEIAKVEETRIGHKTLQEGTHTIVVEFSRPKTVTLEAIPKLTAQVEVGSLKMQNDPIIQHNPNEDRIRLFFDVDTPVQGEVPTTYDMSAQISSSNQPISELWTYTWNP